MPEQGKKLLLIVVDILCVFVGEWLHLTTWLKVG